MKHGSLFSGIGGFDLASEWMGWENVFQVEIDDYCQKVLAKNFPNVKRYGDIKEFKGEAGSVDILTGGFPCQPFSHAGKRKGESDDRYLWPEYLRIIREIKPTWVVAENVAGLISMEDGKTLDGIFTDLEGEGYTIESFIIPACGVGAWHRRDRIWILANSTHGKYRHKVGGGVTKEDKKETGVRKENHPSRVTGRTGKDWETSEGHEDVPGPPNSRTEEMRERGDKTIKQSGNKNATDTTGGGLQREQSKNKGISKTTQRKRSEQADRLERYRKMQPESRVGDLANGLPEELAGYWDREPDIPRVATGVKDRVNKLKGLGKAIVPQVALEIFKAIEGLEYI